MLSIEIVGDVRGSHLMVGIELIRDKSTKAPFTAEEVLGTRVFVQCKKRGLIVRPIGDGIVLSPPLTINLTQIDWLISMLKDSIEAVSLKVLANT